MTWRGGAVAGSILIVALLTSGFLAKRSVERLDSEPPATEALMGLVRPTDVGTIAAPAPITIAEVLVAVGDELAAGDRIIRRDVADEQRAMAQLALAVEHARQDVGFREQAVETITRTMETLVRRTAGLPGQRALAELQAQQVPVRQMRDSPDRARAAYEQALLRQRRAEDLAAAGLLARQDVDEARFAVRLAADDVANATAASEAAERLRNLEAAQARARRDVTIEEQRQQVAQQQNDLDQARLQLKAATMRFDEAQAMLADPYIRAPRSGALIDLPVSAGDRLGAGALIARLGRIDVMALDLDVAPGLINWLSIGDKVRVEVSSASVAADARIRSIAPLPNDAGKYSVHLIFPNTTHAKLAGQAAQAWLAAGPTRTR
jgi:HlyD family secretion protein